LISIHRKLTRSLLATLIGLLLAGGGVAIWTTRAFLIAEFDSALGVKARSLAALVEYEQGRFEFEFEDHFMPEFDLASGADYFEIRLGSGEPLFRSKSLRGGDLPRTIAPEGEELIYDLGLPFERRGRALAYAFQPRASEDTVVDGVLMPPEHWIGAPLEIVVAVDRSHLDAAVASFARGIVLTEAVLLLAVLVLVQIEVRRGLRPLDLLAAEVDAVDEAALDRRLSLENQPVELLGVRRKLNELLGRLQMAFDRERRFSSGAAHELRTPIAELRTLTEVALKWPEGRSETDRTRDLSEAHAIACQMEEVVSALLAIARNGHHEESLEPEFLPLAPIVGGAVEGLTTAAARKRIEIAIEVPEALAVRSSRVPLTTVLRNLAENAVEHAPPGTSVHVSARAVDGAAEVRITNQDATLTEADLPRLFEPFWRKDDSRTDSGHSGLGLAVCDTLSRAIGVSLQVKLEPPGHVTATLTVPRAARSRQSAAPASA